MPADSERYTDDVTGDEFERALCAAALQWPTFLDELPALPTSDNFKLKNASDLWEAILQCRIERGKVIQAHVIQLIQSMGFDAGQAAEVIALADVALVRRDSARESAAYLCARALRKRATNVAVEFLDKLMTCQNRNAADIVSQFERHVIDLAHSSDSADAWKAGHEVSDEQAACVATGIHELDGLTGGLQLGVPGVIAARPSIGKSALMATIAYNIASRGEGVGIFSMDMPAYDLQCRMASARAYVRGPLYSGNSGNPYYDPFLKGKMPEGPHLERMRRAVAEVRQLPIKYDDRHGLTITQIRRAARRLKIEMARNGIPLRAIFVDHIGHIAPERGRGGNRTSEMTDTTQGLLGMARELEDVAVVELSQLNRGVESRTDRRPTLADLRDSGSVEQDATYVMFLYREEYYADRTRSDDEDSEAWAATAHVERNVMEINVAKQRNGPVGTVKLFCEMGANAILTREARNHVRAA